MEAIADKKEDLKLANPQQTSQKYCMVGRGHGRQRASENSLDNASRRLFNHVFSYFP